MRTPKKPQLYDVCRMRSARGIPSELSPDYTVYHESTTRYNIPAVLARRLCEYGPNTGNMVTGGIFYMYVKNGLKPLDILRERIVKKEKKRQAKMFKIADAEYRNSFTETIKP